MAKPRIAFFDFACCEGCQLQVINLEAELLDVLDHVDIVTFREAMSEKSDDYDIAFIEGSITRASDIPRLEKIRENATVLIALGACATIAGVNALKNRRTPQENLRIVYGDDGDKFETFPVRPIDQVVEVDYYLHGCPIDKNEFLEMVKALLMGTAPKQWTSAVCVECKLRENECVYDLGRLCMGPISRGGCDAICPAYGNSCEACRGILPDANIPSMVEVLKAHGASEAEIERRFTNFTAIDKLVQEMEQPQ